MAPACSRMRRSSLLIVDGILVSSRLVSLTLVSYGLMRGWTAWRDLR